MYTFLKHYLQNHLILLLLLLFIGAAQAQAPVTLATLDNPTLFAVDATGNLFAQTESGDFMDFMPPPTYGIAKINPSGAVISVINPLTTQYGVSSIAMDFNGNFYTRENTGDVNKIAPNGTITPVNIVDAMKIVCDSQGNLLVLQYYSADNFMLKKITPSGTVSTVIEPGIINRQDNLCVDANGNVYVLKSNITTDVDSILKISADGNYTVLAGNGILQYLNNITCDAAGNLYVVTTANFQDYSIGKLSVQGNYTTLFTNIKPPSAIVVDAAGAVFLSYKPFRQPGTILKFTATGCTPTTSSETVTTFNNYTWSENNTTYTTSGIYTNVVGCNTATLNLTITPGNPGNEDGNGDLNGQDPPTISQLTSDGSNVITQGCGGSTLVILGTNFSGTTVVTVNGDTVASFVVTNATTITAVLPAGATTGLVAVTTPIGIGSSAGNFAVVAAPASAGTNGSLVICAGSSVSASSLYEAIGGTPATGGTWSAITGGAGTYTYTQTATSPCATDNTAIVTVTESTKPNAGTDGAITLCAGTTPTEAELFAALTGADAGGTWSLPVAGVYTFTVAATTYCPADTATVTVTESSKPNAGTDGAITLCAGTTPTEAELFAALTGADVGGTWSLPVAGVYTFTVAATTYCPADTATVTVTQKAAPNAGTNGTLTVNAGTTPTNAQLFAQLGGSPSIGGSWSNSGLVYTYTVNATSPCTTAATATVTVTENTTTTWNGTAWSNGAPTASLEAIIAGNYSTTAHGAISAKKLTVNSGVLTLNSGNLTVVNELINNAGATAVVFENNANLIQTGTATNTGAITVKRNSSTLRLLDYTLWSSPVASQNLLAFSPATVLSRFYTYNTATNLYNAVPDPANTTFALGSGYLIRMPNTASPSVDTAYPGVFTGVPNNGTIPVTLINEGVGKRFNLVGNPYPSPISMTQFVSDNSANITGTLYFWRKRNGLNGGAYCTWNNGTFITNNNAQSIDPLGIIQTGQGFFVEAKNTATSMTFNNGQRATNNSGQFFKTKQVVENNRIWLNALNANGEFSQMAINYVTGATNGVDSFDAKYFNDGSTALNSVLDNSDYVIQGRALPFDGTDEVPLSLKVTTAGTYSIAIDHVDGLFSGSQDVILKDNATGAETNLKAGAYTFAAEAGANSSRFVLKYQKTLSTITAEFTEDSVIIDSNKGIIHINSGGITMKNVQLFDMSGRLVFKKENVNNSETTIDGSRFAKQVLIVKITSDDNKEVSKKVVN